MISKFGEHKTLSIKVKCFKSGLNASSYLFSNINETAAILFFSDSFSFFLTALILIFAPQEEHFVFLSGPYGVEQEEHLNLNSCTVKVVGQSLLHGSQEQLKWYL